MTEAEWLASDDPLAMITFVLGLRPSHRQAELLDEALTSGQSQAEAATVIRCVVGNPFRPVADSPSWRNEITVAIASLMYESREFSAMPILADALQDAGCDSAEVLDHCRGPGPHVRGCWVVDGVLGKE